MDTLRIGIYSSDPLAAAALKEKLAVSETLQIESSNGVDGFVFINPGADVILFDFGIHPDISISMFETIVETTSSSILALVSGKDSVESILSRLGSESITGVIKGFLDRSSPVEALESALIAVSSGVFVYQPEYGKDPDIGFVFSPEQPGSSFIQENGKPLTIREREVLDLVTRGLPNKAIADELGISEHTVKFHINSILVKLNAQSRTEAVVTAARLGILEL